MNGCEKLCKSPQECETIARKLLKIYIGERCEIYKTAAEQLKINRKFETEK